MKLEITIAAVCVAALAGCHSDARRADASYQTAKARGAGLGELCQLAQEAADTWKIAGDRETYARREEIARLTCLRRDICAATIGGCS